MDSQTERDITESVDGEDWMQDKNQPALPESPASVNLRVYIDGFAVQFTARGNQIAPLTTWVENAIKSGKALGWKPSWKDEPTQPAKPTEYIQKIGSPIENPMCPIHNEKMFKKSGQYGTYFSHGWQQNGYWMNCNGKSTKQGKPVS